jgi:hypothetical protein
MSRAMNVLLDPHCPIKSPAPVSGIRFRINHDIGEMGSPCFVVGSGSAAEIESARRQFGSILYLCLGNPSSAAVPQAEATRDTPGQLPESTNHERQNPGKAGRRERIRTSGPYVPNVVLYQAELLSDKPNGH